MVGGVASDTRRGHRVILREQPLGSPTRFHEETRTYVERCTAEGKTTKEIRRGLKRYLARQIYRIPTTTALADQTAKATLSPA